MSVPTVSPEVASNYDVRNQEGKLMFKAVESVDPIVKDINEIHNQAKPPFVLSIIDMKTGKEVMKINGNLTRGVVSPDYLSPNLFLGTPT